MSLYYDVRHPGNILNVRMRWLRLACKGMQSGNDNKYLSRETYIILHSTVCLPRDENVSSMKRTVFRLLEKTLTLYPVINYLDELVVQSLFDSRHNSISQ